MTHNQHSHHQHTDAIYLGELYLLRPADDHMPTASTDDPNPSKPGSLRELVSGGWELFVTGAKWLAAIVALSVVGQLFG